LKYLYEFSVLKIHCKPGTSGLPLNPSYSGSRDQGDHSWKPAGVNSSRNPISKNDWWSDSRWRPWV
jgi:hypothetical protein